MPSFYKQNHDGILQHDGWIRVAKSKINAKIVNIQGNTIRVKSYNKTKNKIVQYNCELHKRLLPDKKYLQVNDTVSIKWNCSTPYIVGFRKANADDETINKTGDLPVTENHDWINFFDGVDNQ